MGNPSPKSEGVQKYRLTQTNVQKNRQANFTLKVGQLLAWKTLQTGVEPKWQHTQNGYPSNDLTPPWLNEPLRIWDKSLRVGRKSGSHTQNRHDIA